MKNKIHYRMRTKSLNFITLFCVLLIQSCSNSDTNNEWLYQYNNSLIREDAEWLMDKIDYYCNKFPDDNFNEKRALDRIRKYYESSVYLKQVNDSDTIITLMKEYLNQKMDKKYGYVVFNKHVLPLKITNDNNHDLEYELAGGLKIRNSLMIVLYFCKKEKELLYYGADLR